MAVVDAVVPFLLNNITQLLKDEVDLLSGVEDKVVSLQKQLNIMNGFLQDTEGKRYNHEVKAVINQIRDDANEAQDVIDNYVAYKHEQSRRGFWGKSVHSIDYATMLHDVNNKIENLKKSIDDIYANKDKYDIQKGAPTKLELRPDASLQKLRMKVAEDEEVVGFDNHAKEITELLKGGGPRLDVVSIVGMGGLGKTTLARKVYKNDDVKDHFDCCAWASVSQDFRPRDVLTSLLRCLKNKLEEKNVGNNKDEVSEEEVVEILKASVRKELKGLRYLIVLDDIWQIQVWKAIEDAFPNDKNGSRILITSREVALHNNLSGPYRLPFLSKEDSWILFTKKAFGGEECPAQLKVPAKEMVEKCKGLPLSIVVLAGLLQQKEWSKEEWTNINKDVISKIAEDEVGRVKDILKLSYDNLPRRLKPCFLYLGIFPEDYDIPVRQLIRLWIAEGLIESNKDKSLEEVADEDYLKQLINRNLVQMASKRTDGGAKTCRLHDHLRELCISETKDDKFFEVCTSNNIDKMTGRPRRVSVHCRTPHYISASPCDHSYTRSLFFFGPRERFSFHSGRWEWLIKNFKLIRVLDVGQSTSFSFPEDIDKLIHLRYLRVDPSNSYGMVDDSVCELQSLETLDVSGCTMKAFPDKMWKLKRLRHLYMYGKVNLPKLSERQTLWNLQTLSTIALNKKNVLLLEQGRFPNLRKLGLYCTDEGDKITLFLERIQCLQHLNTLKIIYPPHLVKSDKFPPNLTRITLGRVTRLKEESMNALGNLPSLQFLKIKGHGESPYKFDCLPVPQGFKQLQVFQMISFGCEKWELGQDAMPQLRRLVIKQCENLTQLPDQLCSSTTLEEVEVCSEMAEILENLEEVKKVCKLTIKN